MMRPNHTFKHLIDEGFRPFRKDAVVWAKRMGEPFEVLTPEGPVHGEAGDYWCVGPRNQQWLSQAAVFEQIYKPVQHPAGSAAPLMNADAPPDPQAEALQIDGDRHERQVRTQEACWPHARGACRTSTSTPATGPGSSG
jgi:hypothetical protein